MTTTIRRGALAAMVGGTLWALVPIALTVTPIQDAHRSALESVAVVVAAWLVAVAPLALLLIALRGAWAGLADGPLKTAAVAVCAPGLAAMLVGNGTEMATLSAAGQESDLGHAVFEIGVLLLLVGEVLLGIAVLRRRRDGLARAAGIVFVLAIPIGAGLGLLLGALLPHDDAGFWAALTVATGVGWLLLGRALLPRAAEQPALA